MTNTQLMTNTQRLGNAILGYYVSDDFFSKLGFCYPRPMFEKGKILPEHCKFHSSYEWLMDLVEIIDSDPDANLIIDGEETTLTVGGQRLTSGELFDCDLEVAHNTGSKKENLFNALVEYVKWYTGSVLKAKEGELVLQLTAQNNNENVHVKQTIIVTSNDSVNNQIDLFKKSITYKSFYIEIEPTTVPTAEQENWLRDQDWNY